MGAKATARRATLNNRKEAALALVVEDNSSHRSAVRRILSKNRYAKWNVVPYEGSFSVDHVAEWVGKTLMVRTTLPGHASFLIFHGEILRTSFLRFCFVPRMQIFAFMNPALTDGLQLLKRNADRLEPFSTVVISTFGSDAMKGLAATQGPIIQSKNTQIFEGFTPEPQLTRHFL